MLVLLWLIPAALAGIQISCESKSEVCSNGVCKKVVSKSCGGSVENSKPVISCDANGLFSSYSLCAPGVCCSNIPTGLTASLLLLTLLVIFLAFLVVSRPSSSPPPRIEQVKQKKSEPPGAPPPTVPQMQLVTPYSASNPSYHPDPIEISPSAPPAVQIDDV